MKLSKTILQMEMPADGLEALIQKINARDEGLAMMCRTFKIVEIAGIQIGEDGYKVEETK